MQARWRQLLNRFAALSSRERLLILVGIFAVAYQLAHFVVLDRQFEEIQQVRATIAKDRSAIARVGNELGVLAGQVPADPNLSLRRQIARTKAQMDTLQERLEAVTSTLISPQDMARFLEELLVQERELSLLRLQTLEARPLLEQTVVGERRAAPPPLLHRHEFAIEFSGGYMATLRYLEALESLPWRFFWDSVSYDVVEYPESVVRLKLHTLSLSEDWIGV